MKITLNIDDKVMAQLKREAVRQQRTMSELVETALRMLFQASKKRPRLPLYLSSMVAEHRWMSPTETRFIRLCKNVKCSSSMDLLYAADF